MAIAGFDYKGDKYIIRKCRPISKDEVVTYPIVSIFLPPHENRILWFLLVDHMVLLLSIYSFFIFLITVIVTLIVGNNVLYLLLVFFSSLSLIVFYLSITALIRDRILFKFKDYTIKERANNYEIVPKYNCELHVTVDDILTKIIYA